jgi:hypothetical protein
MERSDAVERLEDDLRRRYANTESDLDLREDKLDALASTLEERERRLEAREADLAGYVASVQQQFSAA